MTITRSMALGLSLFFLLVGIQIAAATWHQNNGELQNSDFAGALKELGLPREGVYAVQVPSNMQIRRSFATWVQVSNGTPSFQRIINNSDLVALVEITEFKVSCVKESSRDGQQITLHKAKVLEVLKGTAPLTGHIYIYTLDMYDPAHNVLYVDNGCPQFRSGDKWLLFMYRITHDRNVVFDLPSNVFKCRSHEALKLQNGLLYGLENFDDTVERWLAPYMKISGLPLEEYKQLYLKPP